MKVLVDTSVWIEHLKKPNPELIQHLQNGVVFTHPCVLGELASGNIKRRDLFLSKIRLIPFVKIASFEEALILIETKKLYGIGLHWNDLQILASCLLENAKLLTLDKKLNEVAKKLISV